MAAVDTLATERFGKILARLQEKAIQDYYNPYKTFAWPDTLPTDAPWMTRELTSTHGTAAREELTEAQLTELSRWESVNFYSLNVHGIRELLTEVVNRIHMPGFEVPSDFFHHFIGEENEHMWFFAEFCLRYGGKLYPTAVPFKAASSGGTGVDVDVEHFLVFSRILLFEEIVDHYNLTMADDEHLHDTIRQVNRIHHRDESRHIAFGRELVSLLYEPLRERLDAEQRREVADYLKRYITYSLQSFYNPQVYKDAGIGDPLGFRRRVLEDPARRAHERKAVRKPMGFFAKAGIFEDEELPLVA
ncbi:diiron oxygenase [Streptomyces sp. NPDC057654]|uniref:diiron oxygenase n=1 Tax=Streptomyces sp. NPDC057654 TaxID=3346196 RepID=UPI0036BF34C2